MVSQKRNEGAQLVAAPEETFAGHRIIRSFNVRNADRSSRCPEQRKDCDPTENAERNLSAKT